jgi:hypothetical protein
MPSNPRLELLGRGQGHQLPGWNSPRGITFLYALITPRKGVLWLASPGRDFPNDRAFHYALDIIGLSGGGNAINS